MGTRRIAVGCLKAIIIVFLAYITLFDAAVIYWFIELWKYFKFIL